MEDKLEALESIDLFAGLNRKQLALIARVADRVDVDAGAELIVQGQVMTHMSIIITGAAEVTADEAHVGHVGPGDVLGELSLIDGERASATVTATEPMSLWLVARAGFVPVWDKNRGDISTVMLMAVTKKLRETNRTISSG